MIAVHSKINTRIALVKTNAAGEIVWTGETKNLITNYGLSNFFVSGVFQNMYISSATAVPTTADTGMGGTVASSSGGSTLFPTFTQSVSAGGVITASRGAKFNTPGTYGTVGVGTNSTSTIATKALIRDTGGTPTTVTLLAGESLDVQYSMESQIPTALITGNISGIDYELFQWYGGGGSVNDHCWNPSATFPGFSGQQNFFFGNNAATPAFSGTTVSNTTTTPVGWTNAVGYGSFNGSGDFAWLSAAVVAGDQVSRTFRARVLPAGAVPGNALHGIVVGIQGFHRSLALRFPNTKPSKTNVQEFRLDVTLIITR